MTSVRPDGLVQFRFFRPGARHVSVAGDFTEWNTDELVMRPEPEDDGWWAAVASLPRGEYRFRYVADGQWFTDFASFGVESSQDGWNSVLLVEHQAQQSSMQEAMAA